MKKITSALISVFHKDGLDTLAQEMASLGITIYSTGGTQQYIEKLGVNVKAVEELTSYPSILGGRVKTLHPKVFGGILGRREEERDAEQLAEYDIPEIDLVVVDLYPFEETVAAGGSDEDIIEKIDIGGISLIRAAAKNFHDVLIIPSREDYPFLMQLLKDKQGFSSPEDRKEMAGRAFDISSHYDTVIYQYFNGNSSFKQSIRKSKKLRYGENPHQDASFFGDLDELFEQLHGKELSYNNLLDIDAATGLMSDFKNDVPAFAILKHNNACGMAVRPTLIQAYCDALAGDPVSAFGGILITNRQMDKPTADEINKLFCEVVIAPSFDADALAILKQKKNRIILVQKPCDFPQVKFRSAINGVLVQDADLCTEGIEDLQVVTDKTPSEKEKLDMIFANKLVKHTKSNTIVLAKDDQLLASGTGQTSRVDALKQAIEKAKNFEFELTGAVMASDAF
ncbi:MAG: bifunctional phosphoribosylaminoimidazolecarboxamide formyltransferase/IMP cyclohydrolase, partial [Flavobacteriales bacterium]